MGRPRGTLQILLVEDNPDDEALLRAQLVIDRLDFELTCVDSPEQLDEALKRRWDLVITDFVLPRLRGLDVVDRVMALHDAPPIIVISGTVGEELAVEAIRHGAIDYLLKDRMVRLPAAVRRAVSTRNLETELQQVRFLAESVLSSLAAHIAVIDEDGMILTTNEAWRSHSVCRSGRVEQRPRKGENYLDHFVESPQRQQPEPAARARAGIQSVLDGRETYFQIDYPWHGDGHKSWFSMRVTCLSGPKSGAVISHEEISRYILADARHRLVSQAVDVMSEAMMILNPDLEIIRVNRAFERMTGYGASEVLGKHPPQWPTDADQAKIGQIAETLAGGRPWQHERISRRADGVEFREQCRIVPVADELGEVHFHAAVFEDISEIRDYQYQLESLASFDELTGLLNRRLFRERVQVLLESSRNPAVIKLGFPQLRLIGDRFGHEFEDGYFKAAADRLRDVAGDQAVVGRTGDSTLGAAVMDIDLSTAIGLAETWRSALGRQHSVHGQPLYSEVAIGISIADPDTRSADQLLQTADIALGKAENSSGARVCVYQPEQSRVLDRNLELAGALVQALGNKELYLAYQPRFALGSGRPKRLEALMRWKHPVLGQISPDQFIPVAEETGLILELGRWVIETALEQLVKWRADGVIVPGIAINLSAMQCHDPDLAVWIIQRTAQAGIMPEEVELEITESTLLDFSDGVNSNLVELRDAGFPLAIDDFGTGFSSLSYIKHVRASTLKVDRSFVSELEHSGEDREIIRAIVGLGRALGLTLVAEGVENERQERFLIDLGCDEVQGYRYMKPASAGDVAGELEPSHPLLARAARAGSDENVTPTSQ